MRKQRISLNAYDYQPEEMKAYLRHNGWHFNKKMCEWAVKQMRKNGKPIKFMDKDKLEELLKKYEIELENNTGWDAVYVLNMGAADYYASSIVDEKSLILFVKDTIDDEDQKDGFVFNRWYADTVFNGIPIPWDEIL